MIDGADRLGRQPGAWYSPRAAMALPDTGMVERFPDRREAAHPAQPRLRHRGAISVLRRSNAGGRGHGVAALPRLVSYPPIERATQLRSS